MAYCVVRTDNLSGTHACADLVSFRFYDDDVYADIENGAIVELGGYEPDEWEVRIATAASDASDLTKCAIVASVEMMYNEHDYNLDKFVNKAGDAARGYLLRRGNTFSVTKEGFVSESVPAIGDTVGVGANGKLDKSKSGLGECIDIDSKGYYTYYTILIGDIEAGSGGASLPAVTAEDNGDVLTVVDGAWAKAAPSGGGNIVVVSVTVNQQTGTITADKNYDELLSAVMDNTPVIMAIEGGIIAPFAELEGSGSSIKLIFSNISIQTSSPPKMNVLKMRINPDNTVEAVGQYQYSLTAVS